MAKDIHRSKELDQYIGKRVKVTFDKRKFFYNNELVGILGYGTIYAPHHYNIDGGNHFRKSHVTKIEEV